MCDIIIKTQTNTDKKHSQLLMSSSKDPDSTAGV